MSERRQTHWNAVYRAKHHRDVSWYQEVPERSLAFIHSTGVARDEAIIDIGGGASTLVDCLLDRGHTDVTVLDISAGAIEQARSRLGERAGRVHWIEADVTAFVPERTYAVWHDRAALHFLTDAQDRMRYVDVLCRALQPGGHVVLATFGPDGPLKCSGLDIRRYTVDGTRELLGAGFELLHHDLEEHVTPSGAPQQFLYTSWVRAA